MRHHLAVPLAALLLAPLAAPALAQEGPAPSPSASPSPSPSPEPPPPSPEPEPLLTGTLDGEDGRAVNALLGFDWKDAQGRTLHRTGCVQDKDTCSFAGYGTSIRVNPSLPATGTADTSTATTEWQVQPPPGARRLFLEVYPQNERFRTDEARYGHAMRHSVPLPTGPIALRLPLVLCDEGGRVGTIRGTATKGGQPFALRRVVAWSLEAFDPVVRPVLGWNIGTASADGTFVVPNLPGGQRYQVWVTAADGTVSKTFGVVPPECGETVLPLSFDPPPSPSPSPTPSGLPADPTPEAPVLLPAVSTAGQAVVVEGVVAAEGQAVELVGNESYAPQRLLRSGTAGPNGRYSFTVHPNEDMVLRVRTTGSSTTRPSADGEPALVRVRPVVSARYLRTAPRTYRVEGGVRPGRGQEVLLYQRLGDGSRRLLATGRTGPDGRYALTRRFLVPGPLRLFVATRTSERNLEGSSAVTRVVVS